MSDDPRRIFLHQLFAAGLAAVDARVRTAAALRRHLAQTNWPQRWQVIAVGKAASRMMLGASEVLGPRLVRGWLTTKDAHIDAQCAALPHIRCLESGHPLPDQRSLDAGSE